MTDKDINLIKIFLIKKNEKLINIKKLSGGNNNRIYSVNDKYFVKFKDRFAILEEKNYFTYYKGDYYPKIHCADLRNNFIVYDLLDANDISDAREVKNLINIAYDLSYNTKKTRRKGYGYYGMESESWVDFLKKEINVSKEFLKSNIKSDDLKIVDKALNVISKYTIDKRILHGDFGLHNIMVKNNEKIYIIDPEMVLGDWIYDFIFFCFSDITLTKMITIDEIIKRIDQNNDKTIATMIVVLFNRLRRIYKYSNKDYDEYLKLWERLKVMLND